MSPEHDDDVTDEQAGEYCPDEPAPEIDDLFAQFQQASDHLVDDAEDASTTILQGSAAGGAVTVQITGALEAVAVRIDPALADPADVPMLEDAVLAAMRDALEQVVQLQEQLATDYQDAEMDLSALIGKLGGLTNFGSLGLPDLAGIGDPDELMAGLSGALGSLPEGLIGQMTAGFPGGFGEVMSGLGLGAPPTPADAGDSAPTEEGEDEEAPE